MAEPVNIQGRTEADFRAGEKLFKGGWTFLKGVAGLDGLPEGKTPEVAFAGRSNVGKSSLLNALTGRKALARTSNTPGRTQQLNFFRSESGSIDLVDLPGYGYAKASRDVVEAWTDLVIDYLRGRANLQRVLLLIDARRGITAVDQEVMKILDLAAVSYLVVLTKIDKLKKTEVEPVRAKVDAELKKHPAAYPEVLVTSAQKGIGLEAVRAEVAFHVAAA